MSKAIRLSGGLEKGQTKGAIASKGRGKDEVNMRERGRRKLVRSQPDSNRSSTQKT
jgi:hypothetical protein